MQTPGRSGWDRKEMALSEGLTSYYSHPLADAFFLTMIHHIKTCVHMCVPKRITRVKPTPFLIYHFCQGGRHTAYLSYLTPRLNHQLQAFPSKGRAFCCGRRPQQTPPASQGFSGLSLFSPGRAAWLHAPVLRHMPVSAFNPEGKPHPQGCTCTTGDRADFLPTAPLPQTILAAG